MDTNKLFQNKTVTIHNFTDKIEKKELSKQDYVLYFGRFSREKGINTLIDVCKVLPEIKFVFAGTGPLENVLSTVPNVENKGFVKGIELKELIANAKFSIYPSEWYEPFGLSIIESQECGTPVIGARIGGITELIEDDVNGRLFESGNKNELIKIIRELWNNPDKLNAYTQKCVNEKRMDIESYYYQLIEIYRE